MIDKLITYLYAAMLYWSPISNHNYKEVAAITQARYMQIAHDVADKAFIEAPFVDGEYSRERSALVILSIASFESGGFRGDVQFCQKFGAQGEAGIFQSKKPKSIICNSLWDSIHIAYEQVRESIDACQTLPVEQRLSVYASGDCVHGKGASRRRWERAVKYWSTHKYE